MPSAIAIVGAGIGGLTAALAFSRQGCAVDVFEQSPEIREIGAGIQLSSNATRVLDRIGLTEALAKSWYEPEGIALISGFDLNVLARLPLGSFARQRWSHPYAVIHRPDLITALANALKKHDQCKLHFGATIPPQPEDQTAETIRELTGRNPDLIVFADGVWSHKRDSLGGSTPASFTGYVAWRATASASVFASLAPTDHIGAYLGPRSHLVSYPMGNSEAINLVAATPGEPSRPDWEAVGNLETLKNHFSGWNAKILDALETTTWHIWPLFEARNQQWRDGSKTVLIGDAAHAMSPHAAQGAAMAIEDAEELANCFGSHDGNAASAISDFIRIRQPRVNRVRRRGDLNKFAYHASGPVRMARDFTFRLRGGTGLVTGMDWLYGHQCGTAR